MASRLIVKLIRERSVKRGYRSLILVVPAIVGFLPCAFAQQAYPERPIRLISPFPPGGTNDWLTRMVAKHFSDTFRQPVVVENRPGGGTLIATELMVKSPPDGYTLLMSSNTALAIAPGLYARLPFDPAKDVTYVGVVGYSTHLVGANPTVPAKSVKELVALSKARPGKLTFGSPGNGTPGHLAGELFKSMTGTSIVHVPYKGGAGSLVALVGGEIDLVWNTIGAMLPLVKAGRIRALAVTSAARTPLLPDLPTVAESGLPGYEANVLYCIVGPVGLPKEILARLNAEIANSMRTQAMKEGMVTRDVEPMPMSPEQFAATIRDETAKWAKVIRISGAKPD